MTCKNNGNAATADKARTDSVPVKKEFRMVAIPDGLTAEKDRAYFLVSHYWDNFDFTDTAYIHMPGVTEQAFADYIEVLPHTQKEIAYVSIKNMLTKAGSDTTGKMYSYFLALYKKYLYDPNSPLHNEEYYIPVAEHIISDTLSSEAEKERAKFTLSLMMKNRVGHPATDFTYTMDSGKTGRLYDTAASYTLLYFYNPDCHACEELINYMRISSLINSLTTNGTLKILAIYPDRDISIWQKHLKDMPAEWINGYDKNTVINDKQLYDLKAIPSIYLLDKDKRVILKDADIRKVEEYLQGNNTILVAK
jgi:hypothetical protein